MMAAVGESDLAWVCADRSIFAAERAQDFANVGAGYFRLTIAFLNKGDSDAAVRASRQGLLTVSRLPMDQANIPAICGALSLSLSIGLARLNDRVATEDALGKAEELAHLCADDTNAFHTEFNSANVLLHRIAAYVELGLPRMALDCSEKVEIVMLSQERQARYYVDVARAHFELRKIDLFFDMLQRAHQLAPQGVSENWFIREILAYMKDNKFVLLPHQRALLDRVLSVD